MIDKRHGGPYDADSYYNRDKDPHYYVGATCSSERVDKRHGGPYDRGSADSYYNRGRDPHYYVGATYSSERVDITDITSVEYKEYMLGYEDNQYIGSHKKWD